VQNDVAAPLRVVAVTYSPGEALEGFVSSLAEATTRPVEVVLAAADVHKAGRAKTGPRTAQWPRLHGPCSGVQQRVSSTASRWRT
jgi:hypothetical protein